MRSLGMFLIALPLLLSGSPARAEPPPAFLGAWGSEGTRIGEFRCPTGLAFDAEGHIVVADSRNARIQLFQTDGTPVEVLRRAGAGEVPMLHPQAVGTCHSGRIYVTDTESNRIWVFDRGGLPLDDWGGPGIAPGLFREPGGVDVLSDGSVLVADWGNDRIQRLNGTGACMCEWTPSGVGPFSVACDHFGHVFVADRNGCTISKYSCTGTLLETWGGRGRGPSEFLFPHDIACDDVGNVYVADTYNYRVQKFDNHGRFLTAWGEFGQGGGQFVRAVALAVGQDGVVAVADDALHRIQVFGTPPEVRAFMDVMPGVCPNEFGTTAGGTMKVALLGTAGFDALEADPATLRFAGLPAALTAIGDLSRLPEDLLDPCACTTGGPDGFDDLVLTFGVDDVRSALGTADRVTLTGALRDGTPFAAVACLTFREFDPPGATPTREPIAIRLESCAGSIDMVVSLAADARTRLTVHDIGGRVVGRLMDGWSAKGEHRLEWRPDGLKSGVYFFRLEGGDRVVVKRISLVK